MKRLSINKGLLFIGGIVLVLFLHFVPVGACDIDNIYNNPGEEIMAGAGDNEIVMAPRHQVLRLQAKYVSLKDRKIGAGETNEVPDSNP